MKGRKTYRVCFRLTDYRYIDINAESLEAAEAVAEEADGDMFKDPHYDVVWEVASVVNRKEEPRNIPLTPPTKRETITSPFKIETSLFDRDDGDHTHDDRIL